MQTLNAKTRSCRCGAKAVYFRAYNGEALCSACFSSSIIEKSRRTIAKYSMLSYGDNIAVALSGGKDSASLLYALQKIVSGHGSNLFAITIDEGIKGYREEAIENARNLCERLSVPLTVGTYEEYFGTTLDDALAQRDSKGKRGATSCAICGPLRRRAIDIAAKSIGAKVVATAHNLDDMLQTFFINLYSGDEQRIAWLDPKRLGNAGFNLRRIKPFMEIYEQELAFFAYINNLPFQSESCPYMNEGIRTEIREHLNALEIHHPGIKFSTLQTVLSISNGLDSTPADTKQLMNCRRCGSPSSSFLCSVCKTLELVSSPEE